MKYTEALPIDGRVFKEVWPDRRGSIGVYEGSLDVIRRYKALYGEYPSAPNWEYCSPGEWEFPLPENQEVTP